jgi:cell pole-organizing protein PopZ
VWAQVIAMSDKKLSPDPSMDEILASIRRIIAEDDYAVPRPSPRDRVGGDILDLTEAVNDDGSVRHIPPIALVTPEPPPRLPDGRIEPAPPRPADAAAEPALVSDAASDAVAASFARLASVPRREEGDHSLDDLVRETLRPLLQAWLDEHLPELVERLVRAEIARVVGAIRPAAP